MPGHPGGDGPYARVSRPGDAARSLAEEMDMATADVFAFAGARCDRIVAGVLERLRCSTPADRRDAGLSRAHAGGNSDAAAVI